MLILLSRSSSQRKRQSVESSKHMLHLLEDMVSDSEESYNGIVWHLVCSPFTAFLALFGEILSNNERGSEEHRDALIAMEKLPVFLRNMGFRNSLAAKLERTATVLVQHARTVVQSQGMCTIECFGSGSYMTNHSVLQTIELASWHQSQEMRIRSCPMVRCRMGMW